MARLIISTDKNVNDKATAMLAKDTRPTMFFKDEGGFYITKFTKDNVPAEPNTMYEYGSLTEKTVYNKREANKLALEYGYKAVFG